MARILVIDDDPDQATLVRWIVRRRGIDPDRVQHVPCVDIAVARLSAERFDVVLLDHRVPPDDTAALAVPRLRRAGHAGPITVMSSAAPDPRALAALANMGASYVSKFDLLDHLAAMLATRVAA